MKNRTVPLLACLALAGLALAGGVPAAQALDQTSPPFSSRPNTTYAYVDSKADGGSLDVSGTFYTRADGGAAYANAKVKVTDPTGKVAWEYLNPMPAGSHSKTLSFSKLALTSDTAGVWVIETAGVDDAGANSGGGGIIPFRVAPCREVSRDTSKPCSAPLSGRVWWEKLSLEQRAFTGVSGSKDILNFSLWTLSPWGVQHKITQYGFQGISSSIQVNNLGLVDGQCEPVYHSDNMRVGTAVKATAGNAACAGKYYAYRLFAERPDSTMPAKGMQQGKETWVMPQYQTLTSSIEYTPSDPESPYYGGVVKVAAGHQPGYLKLELDSDGDGQYDRTIVEEHVVPGTYSYDWDGKDAKGKLLDRYTAIKLRVSFTGVGEVHWVLDDVETRTGGFGVERLNGEPYSSGTKPAQADVVSWDDAWVSAKDGGKCHFLSGEDPTSTPGALYTCKGSIPTMLKADSIPSSQAKAAHGWGDTATNTTWGDGRYIEDWQLTSQIIHASTVEVSTEERAGLLVTKDDGVEEANPGDTLDYTLTVTNTHPWMFESAATLKDHLPDHTTFVSASDDGVYDEQTRTVTWPEFPLVGGESVQRTLTVIVDEDAPPGSDLVNYATVSGDSSGQKATETPQDECVEPLCASDTDSIPLPPEPEPEPIPTQTPSAEPIVVPSIDPPHTPIVADADEVIPVRIVHTGGSVQTNWWPLWGMALGSLMLAAMVLIAVRLRNTKRS